MVNDVNFLFEENAPEEVRKTLLQFLGQTYQEVSQYDNNIVSPNQFLSPKKYEFQKTAEKVMQEALNTSSRPPAAPNYPQRQIVHPQNEQVPNKPFLETGGVVPPPLNDPNQMEFSFDNSVTAITINNKLDEMNKRLKSLEKNISKVIDFMKSHEPKDTK